MKKIAPRMKRPAWPNCWITTPVRGLGAVFARKARTARFGADVRKRGIDRDEQKARDEAREDRLADDARVLRDAERADVHRDDEAEVEGRERVHRLIALDEAADERRRVIGGAHGAVLAERMHDGGDEEHRDEREQRGARGSCRGAA